MRISLLAVHSQMVASAPFLSGSLRRGSFDRNRFRIASIWSHSPPRPVASKASGIFRNQIITGRAKMLQNKTDQISQADCRSPICWGFGSGFHRNPSKGIKKVLRALESAKMWDFVWEPGSRRHLQVIDNIRSETRLSKHILLFSRFWVCKVYI